MELYEALKSGASSRELEEAFRRDLDEAVKRIEAEKVEAEKANKLTTARNTLATDIYVYACAFMGEKAVKKAGISIKSIKEKLRDSEKELVQFCKLDKKIDDIFNKICNSNKSDEDIINSFLKQLH
jgi:hypothetical protein